MPRGLIEKLIFTLKRGWLLWNEPQMLPGFRRAIMSLEGGITWEGSTNPSTGKLRGDVIQSRLLHYDASRVLSQIF